MLSCSIHYTWEAICDLSSTVNWTTGSRLFRGDWQHWTFTSNSSTYYIYNVQCTIYYVLLVLVLAGSSQPCLGWRVRRVRWRGHIAYSGTSPSPACGFVRTFDWMIDSGTAHLAAQPSHYLCPLNTFPVGRSPFWRHNWRVPTRLQYNIPHEHHATSKYTIATRNGKRLSKRAQTAPVTPPPGITNRPTTPTASTSAGRFRGLAYGTTDPQSPMNTAPIL